MKLSLTSTLSKDKATYSIESTLLDNAPEGIEPIVSVEEQYEGVKGTWTCLYRASKVKPDEWDYERYLIVNHNGQDFYLGYISSNGSPVFSQEEQEQMNAIDQ